MKKIRLFSLIIVISLFITTLMTASIASAIFIPPPTYYPGILMGYVTGDGRVTPADSLRILQYCAGKITFTDSQKLAADTNYDGKITPADALYLIMIQPGTVM